MDYTEDFEKSLNPPSFPLELSSIYNGVICQFVEKKSKRCLHFIIKNFAHINNKVKNCIAINTTTEGVVRVEG